MTIHFPAIYENGVLKPLVPVDLDEHARVHVSVETAPRAPTESDEASEAEIIERQRLAWEELREEIAKLPQVKNTDGLTNRDHDQILYGKP